MNRTRASAALGVLLTLGGCGGERPDFLGVNDGKLAACPEKPNCVSSDAEDAAQKIEPFRFDGDQVAAWTALKSAVADLPRTIIITSDDTYLHAEARSRIFRFVDDLEFHLRPDESLIAIRSASRTGYSDFGVNAERLESLRGLVQTANAPSS